MIRPRRLAPKLRRRIRDPRAPFSRAPWREQPVHALSLGTTFLAPGLTYEPGTPPEDVRFRWWHRLGFWADSVITNGRLTEGKIKPAAHRPIPDSVMTRPGGHVRRTTRRERLAAWWRWYIKHDR